MSPATRTDLPTFDELRWWMNTVRPVRTADLLGSVLSEPLPGLQMRVELHRGRASQGYKTNMERVETWWVTNSAIRLDAPGRRFTRGTRYSGKSAEAKARRDYGDAVAAAEGGGA